MKNKSQASIRATQCCPLNRRVKLGICEIDQPCNGTLVEYGSGPDLVLRCVECGSQWTMDGKEGKQ